MCLTLYLATDRPLSATTSGPLSAACVGDSLASRLGQALQKPHRHHLKLDGFSCCCDFPSICSEQPIEWHEEMFAAETAESRARAITCVESLLELLDGALRPGETAELWPVWSDEEDQPPLGRVFVHLDRVTPERFLLVERFVYEITR